MRHKRVDAVVAVGAMVFFGLVFLWALLGIVLEPYQP